MVKGGVCGSKTVLGLSQNSYKGGGGCQRRVGDGLIKCNKLGNVGYGWKECGCVLIGRAWGG